MNIGHRGFSFFPWKPQRQRTAAGQPARGDRPQAARTGLSSGPGGFISGSQGLGGGRRFMGLLTQGYEVHVGCV